MTDAPNTLRQTFDSDGGKITVIVPREVADADAGRIDNPLTSEEFGDWWEANADRILKSALHKMKHVMKHDLVAGPVWIKSGELLG